jgi:SAM-dependent methyltransferase
MSWPYDTNLAEVAREKWKPPLFTRSSSRLDRLVGALRRFFDLPAGSIWSDLRIVLPGVAGTVLDMGCGAQPYRILFANEISYIGLDTADAKSHFGYELPDTRYFAGTEWPVESGTANFVLCTETLEHVQDPGKMLREAFRCLRPGGQLLLTVPFAARWHFIPFDYWRFTPSGLKLLLEREGFASVLIGARGNAFTVACYKAMALLLPFLFPQSEHALARLLRRVIGLPMLPVLAGLATLGNVSLKLGGGDDCLGYTACATRPGDS